jgi:hypothetical protein
MKKKRTTLGLILALTLGASAAVNADVLYNNIPDLDYDINQDINDPFTVRDYIDGNQTGRPLNLTGDYVASLFAMPACASNCSPLTLGNITLAMFAVANSVTGSPLAAGNITLAVYSNTHLNTPVEGQDPGLEGDEIYDTIDLAGGPLTTLTLNSSNFSTSTENNVFTPNTPLALTYDTKYWVKFSASGGSLPSGATATWMDLSLNDINAFIPNDGNNDTNLVGQPPASFVYCAGCGTNLPVHGDFSTDPQLLMKVEATAAAVPVPGAAWLMGSALLGLMRPWRRKGGH